ncbi:hypothetical protein PHSY_001103 [Pseudozyma hubeiensis SY62]|uniref:Aprataxin C2HE/C2H2/C2HC zinc finger domain-containing protein n=1 Tax=Pseudozyma hubeiensis (strain SY62) TaxID=1305764 RepID=R9NXS3_PSEHS|nr:hypothetical protein PHSY_001103 [Pseudozyma hubeiensis SY62]GAC93538.1 hypothetical protein PHSY_001103 [Pseudozyma hubeiensis SY62]
MTPTWNQALVRIASAKDPTTLPTDDRVLFYDDLTITIYDKFAKAQYHFLVLPRIPFRPSLSASASIPQQGAPTLSASNGKLNFGATSSNNVPASHMKSISSVLASPYAGQVLEALRTASERVVQHIRDDMKQNYDVAWDVERAFHSVPSMEHLHLHVVSMDLVSDRLKHKKHYLSFHPSVGFALRLDKVQDMVREGKKTLPKSEGTYERLLRGPLESHHTCQVFRFFPELKAHLDMYWRQKILPTGVQPEALQETAKTYGKRDASDLAGGAASASDKGTAQRPLQSRKVELANTAAEDSTGSDDEEVSLPTR